MYVSIEIIVQAINTLLNYRFVDRDMMARFLGLGVGHLKVKAAGHETMPIIYDYCRTNEDSAEGEPCIACR